jgi:transcriptional regulator with XRE-family HTH domain
METQIHKRIALRIKQLLKTRGISAERLAFECGLSKSFMYGYLAGKTRAGVESLEKIAEGLEVPLRELFPD